MNINKQSPETPKFDLNVNSAHTHVDTPIRPKPEVVLLMVVVVKLKATEPHRNTFCGCSSWCSL